MRAVWRSHQAQHTLLLGGWHRLLFVTGGNAAHIGFNPYLEEMRGLIGCMVELTVLHDAIEQTLDSQPPRRLPQPGVPTITRSQAEVLRLMADGLSNAAIAEQRGCSVRALERVNARLYAALGVKDDADANARVQAVGMYRDGRVDVR